jgi:sporulation protein YlmC with PRC-barrel domain
MNEMNQTDYPHVLSATKLMGNKVVNTAGEQLGTVKELMIDLDDDRLRRIILWRFPGVGR